MHRILYITDAADPLAEKVRAVADGRVELEVIPGANVPASFSAFDALLIGDGPVSPPIASLGENAPKLVQLTRGHHADVDAAALITSGTTVAGASPVLAPYVARHALGLAIAASGEDGKQAKKGSATISTDLESQRAALANMTVGVVGFGRVGRAMTDLCTMLGATVIYADIRTAQHGSAAKAGVRRSTLDLLLSKSDIVSLHVQWGPTSNPLIGARELRLMGRGGVLLNTADARLVDTEALIDSLQVGRVKAGLDIADIEHSTLAELPGCVWTPYTAARSAEADENVAEFVIDNIESALSGGTPDGIIEILDFPPIGDPAFWSSKMSPRIV